jgi:hypothetical protein
MHLNFDSLTYMGVINVSKPHCTLIWHSLTSVCVPTLACVTFTLDYLQHLTRVIFVSYQGDNSRWQHIPFVSVTVNVCTCTTVATFFFTWFRLVTATPASVIHSFTTDKFLGILTCNQRECRTVTAATRHFHLLLKHRCIIIDLFFFYYYYFLGEIFTWTKNRVVASKHTHLLVFTSVWVLTQRIPTPASLSYLLQFA